MRSERKALLQLASLGVQSASNLLWSTTLKQPSALSVTNTVSGSLCALGVLSAVGVTCRQMGTSSRGVPASAAAS